MKWFRFFHDSLDDPKIQSLPSDTFKAWANLLCIASKQKARGTLPPVPDIAFRLRLGLEETQAILDDLAARSLLDKTAEGYRPHDWDEWQTDRSGNAVRQKRYRERHSNATKPESHVTHNGASNVTRYVTGALPVMGELDRDREREENPPTPLKGEHACVPFSSPEPFDVPEGANPEVPRVSGPGRGSPEAVDLEAWAARLGTDSQHESYAVWARAKCDYVPVAWIRVLLERKVDGRGGSNRASINLLGHILGQWMNAGECEYLKAIPKPPPPTEKPIKYHTAPPGRRIKFVPPPTQAWRHG